MSTSFILTNLKTIDIIYNIMKKIMSILAKLFVWAMVGLFSAMLNHTN